MTAFSICSASPFFVYEKRTHLGVSTYEYSPYAATVGADFVKAICAKAKGDFLASLPNIRSRAESYCIDVYISHLHLLFSTLEVLLSNLSLSSVDDMTTANWQAFTAELMIAIESDPHRSQASKRLSKRKYCAALKRYAAAGLIPENYDRPPVAIDGPYYVLRKVLPSGRVLISYEYDTIAERLGKDFLKSACAIVRKLRYTAGVTEKTWLDNYATRFDFWIRELYCFLDSGGFDSAQDLNDDDWQCFVDWLGGSIYGGRISERTGKQLSALTKTKVRLSTNNLFANFALDGLLPKRYEIPALEGRRWAADGLSRSAGRSRPYEHENEIVAPRSPFSFIVEHDKRAKVYDYEEFSPLANQFLLAAMPILNREYSSRSQSTAKQRHQAFNAVLRFLQKQKNDGRFPAFFRALASEEYMGIDCLIWEQVLYAWRGQVTSQTPESKKGNALVTKDHLIKHVNRLWQAFADAEIVPTVRLIGIKNARLRSNTKARPSLAQLSYEDRAPAELAQKARNEAAQKLTRYFDEHEKSEAVEFINALVAHLPAEQIAPLTLDSLIVEVNNLNAIRLDTLRHCAESDFLFWYNHWLTGQRAMAEATHTPDQLVDLLDRQERSISQRRRNSTELINGTTEQHLGNTLNLLIGALDGNISSIDGRYHHIARRWGGRERLHAYLHPHKRATLALWVLLLVDTGVNCEVAREMPLDCFRKTEDPAFMGLYFGLKARAGYKRINDCLPVEPQNQQKLSTIQAIKLHMLMSERYRKAALGKVSELLLLDRRGAEIIGVTEFSARDDFKQFLSDHPELKHLAIRPSFIRPSVLLRTQHGNSEAPMELAQIQADHASSSTTQAYTLRAPTKLVYVKNIRDFTKRYQAVIIASIEGAAQKLGISVSDAEVLFSDASRSGLGIACLAPKGGIQPGTRSGENCTRFDKCPGCESHYLVGTVDNIADLILFEEFLRSRETDAVKANPQKWEKQWIPWLVLAEVALAKFSQGETAAAYLQARTQADLRRPTYIPFPLF